MEKARIDFEFKRAENGLRGSARKQLAKLNFIMVARRVYSTDGFICTMPKGSDIGDVFSFALSSEVK